MTGSLVPLALLATSLVPAVVIFLLPAGAHRTRTTVNLGGALAKVGLVAVLTPLAAAGDTFAFRVPFVPGADLLLQVTPFGLYFLALSSVLWLVTTVYAVGYFRREGALNRFFGFFSLCVAATTGVALAGNPLTLVVFFEILTLVTYPLVVHDGTAAALRGGRTYLTYTLLGGAALLTGAVWLTAEVGSVDFARAGGPEVAALAERQPGVAIAIFVLMAAGMGVKAALVPLHGWLPRAMVAPAPVSALLHAVAVVKAGVFGLVLLVDYVFGVEVAARLGVLTPLAVWASVTIVWGSVRALRAEGVKELLAFSTVSQVSYVTLGIALASPTATTGGLAHIVNQGVMKITLFFCAGLFATMLGATRIAELEGAGRRMPVTSASFTVAALGMIGIPPLAGFTSKWYLATGALDAGAGAVVAVLVVSSLLNAAYFLPVVRRLWWPAPQDTDAATAPRTGGREAPAALLVPTVVTAVAVVALGVVAGWNYSPPEITEGLVEEIYR